MPREKYDAVADLGIPMLERLSRLGIEEMRLAVELSYPQITELARRRPAPPGA